VEHTKFNIGNVGVCVRGSVTAFFSAELRSFAVNNEMESPYVIYIDEVNSINAPFYEKISMREGKRFIHVPFEDLDSQVIHLTYERGLSPAFVFYIFEAVLHFFLLKSGYALVHGASFTLGGKGVWLSSWGGTGKTNFILYGLTAVEDFSYMADDWTIVSSSGMILAYPKRIRIYGYNLLEYPNLPVKSRRAKILAYKAQRGLYNILPSRWLRIALSKFEPKILLYPSSIRQNVEVVKESRAYLSLLMKKGSVDEPVLGSIDIKSFVNSVLACVRFERNYLFKEYYRFVHYVGPVEIVENHDDMLRKILNSYLKKSQKVLMVEVPSVMNKLNVSRLYKLIRKLLEASRSEP